MDGARAIELAASVGLEVVRFDKRHFGIFRISGRQVRAGEGHERSVWAEVTGKVPRKVPSTSFAPCVRAAGEVELTAPAQDLLLTGHSEGAFQLSHARSCVARGGLGTSESAPTQRCLRLCLNNNPPRPELSQNSLVHHFHEPPVRCPRGDWATDLAHPISASPEGAAPTRQCSHSAEGEPAIGGPPVFEHYPAARVLAHAVSTAFLSPPTH
jgi:hypothetical protein